MTTNSLASKTVCVVDTGHCVELALRLARDFKKVWYHTPWQETSPHLHELAMGDGLDGLERVNYFWNPRFQDQVDLFVFPWTFFWDWQAKLRSEGRRVWGAGPGECLETYRHYFKDQLKASGLPTWPYQSVIGLDSLIKYLAEHEDVYVKVNGTMRGDSESWHSVNGDLSRPKLDLLRHRWGRQAERVEFIVEDAIPDAVEDGCDGYCVDGQFPDRVFESLEIKDSCMICSLKPYDKLSEPVRLINERMAPFLKRNLFRGFWGTETRVMPDGVSHFTDATCRQSSPMGELYQEMLENISEIVWHGGNGNLVQPVCEYEFGLEAMIFSAGAMQSHVEYELPDANRRWLKFHYLSGDGKRLCQDPALLGKDNPRQVIGAVLGVGHTLQEALDHLKDNFDSLTSQDAEIRLDAFAEGFSALEEGKGRGIHLTRGPMPEAEEVLRD